MAEPLININKKNAYYFAIFLVLYQFSTYVANDMIMPAMISIVHYFNAPESAIETSLTAFILGGASLQLFLGPLSDNLGRRPIMLFGCLLFLVTTLILPFSHNIVQFLLARFFEGMGLCFIGVVGYAALQEIFDEMDAVRISAVLTSVASLAPLLGPLMGAIMIQFFEWKKIFIVIAALGLSALIGLWKYMPETIGVTQRSGVQIKATPLHPRVVFSNYSTLLKDKSFLMGSIAIGLMGVPMIIWIAISPIILISAEHLSISEYALWQLPIIGSTILGNIVLRRLSYKKTLNQLVTYGALPMMAAPIIALMLFAFLGNQYYWIIIMMIIYGGGVGISSAPLYRQILSLSKHNKGTASAIISLFTMLASAASVQLMTIIYAHHNNLKLVVTVLFYTFVYLTLYFILRTRLEESPRIKLIIKDWLSLKHIKFKRFKK